MANLIGQGANQVPVNGMLGTAAFTDAKVWADDAANSAKAAKRAAFMAAGNTLQVQQMAVVVANSASRSRSYFYGNF